jgi:hypothetical protein
VALPTCFCWPAFVAVKASGAKNARRISGLGNVISRMASVLRGGDCVGDVRRWRVRLAGLSPSGQALALGRYLPRPPTASAAARSTQAFAPAITSLLGPGCWEGTPAPVKQMVRDNAHTLLGQIKETRAPSSRADAQAIRAPMLIMANCRHPPSIGSSTGCKPRYRTSAA